MARRKIIEIDSEKCNGCGECLPNCPEGALQIIDGKARLVSDLFCDGLGACIGHCPKGAIKIIERDAKPYDERKVMGKIARQGESTIKAHLEHLKEHGQEGHLKEAVGFLEDKGLENPLEKHTAKPPPLPCNCPGTAVKYFRSRARPGAAKTRQEPELRQWPVQLALAPPSAPCFDNADLLVAADCVPFAYANFHPDFLKGRALLIGCPKLDNIELYREKIAEILTSNNIKSITVLHMEVPCCFSLQQAVERALEASGKNIELVEKVVSIQGSVK